jgi:glycosyltransferase involved in cell wall biosynthesis
MVRAVSSGATPTESAHTSTEAPLVSVIVPTRNSERYLSVCLRSVTEQDYQNLELLVVDRDSTDSTVPIALAFGATVLIAGPERSAQVNAGVLVARGRFLFRVDADFALDPAVVSECVSLAARGADAVVVHNRPACSCDDSRLRVPARQASLARPVRPRAERPAPVPADLSHVPA